MSAEETSKRELAEELDLKHREREALRADLRKIGQVTREALAKLGEGEEREGEITVWRVRWPWTKH